MTTLNHREVVARSLFLGKLAIEIHYHKGLRVS